MDCLFDCVAYVSYRPFLDFHFPVGRLVLVKRFVLSLTLSDPVPGGGPSVYWPVPFCPVSAGGCMVFTVFQLNLSFGYFHCQFVRHFISHYPYVAFDFPCMTSLL